MTSSMSAAFIAILLLTVLLAAIKAVRLSIQSLVIGLVGAITGLLCGALLSVPLGTLPEPFSTILPIILTILLAICLSAVALSQREGILKHFPLLNVGPKLPNTPQVSAAPGEPVPAPFEHQIVVDTSVIIDGRIADIAGTGFVRGELLVPRFVLAELQNIADSEDAMRRGRGRRGLEMLKIIRETSGLVVTVVEEDFEEIKEVDAKLVAMAKARGADVMTTDFNLNRVAQIEGVRVLNINELTNAIRPVVIPGEQMVVHIVQKGKERGQGVGYLADGTMIVVDQGDGLIGQSVATEVTRVFQTVAGKMIFAAPIKQQKAAKEQPPAVRPMGDRARGRVPKPAVPPETIPAETQVLGSSVSTLPTATKAPDQAMPTVSGESRPQQPSGPRQNPSRQGRGPRHSASGGHRFRSQSQIEDSLVSHTNAEPTSSATPAEAAAPAIDPRA
jgi:uncharacterized protein YacL